MKKGHGSVKAGKFGLAVEIDDLRGFVRDLRRAGPESAQRIRNVDMKVASLIMDDATTLASERKQSAKAAESLTALSLPGGGAGIRLGDAQHQFAMGAEFGALAYAQFPLWRGNQWMSWDGGPGYFLHPAIRQDADKATELYGAEIEKLYGEAAFPD
jgi:hypothetical protein